MKDSFQIAKMFHGPLSSVPPADTIPNTTSTANTTNMTSPEVTNNNLPTTNRPAQFVHYYEMKRSLIL